MRRSLITIALLSVFLCGFTVLAHSQNAFSVNSVRIGTHPDKERMVIELSDNVDFRVFPLESPPRLIIDLPGFNWKAGTPALPPGTIVKNVRYGLLEKGKSRIVVDLIKSATPQSAFVIQAAEGKPDRLVIDYTLNLSGQSSPEKALGKLAPENTITADLDRLKNAPYSPSKGFLALPENAQSVKDTKEPPKEKQESPLAASVKNAPEKSVEPRDSETNAPWKSGEKPLIVIDPGHGGQDPGAIGKNGKQEKDVTLAVAKELKASLENTGRYRVHLTRSTDKFIKLQDRVAIGRKKGADLFISLHADSIDKPGVSGASIYTLSNKASDSQTAKLAARENRADLIAGVDLSHEDKEVANILIDLAMRDTMNQSKFFANQIVRRASAGGIELLEKPHRFAGFAVLKAPDIPSVLIEMGFMSNQREVTQLSSPAYRRKIASAITSGIDAYFAKVNKD